MSLQSRPTHEFNVTFLTHERLNNLTTVVCMVIVVILILEACMTFCTIRLVLLFHVLLQDIVVEEGNRAGIAPMRIVQLFDINDNLFGFDATT